MFYPNKVRGILANRVRQNPPYFIHNHQVFSVFTYTHLIWPFIITVIFVTVLWVLSLRQPPRPGTRYFKILMGLWLLEALAATFQMVLQDLEVRFFFLELQVITILLIAPALLCFAIEYTGLGNWLNRRRLILLFLPSLVFSLVVFTNASHGLIWPNIENDLNAELARTELSNVIIVFHYIFWLINLGVLVRCILQAPAFRWTILLLIFGQIMPRLAYITDISWAIELSPVHLSILLSNLTALVYFTALFNLKLFRVVPVARHAILDRMTHAVLVLDAENHLVDFNQPARELPGMPRWPTQRIQRRPGTQALGDWWPRIAPLLVPTASSVEVMVGEAPHPIIYQITSQPLLHASGWRMGQLLIFNDITLARQAQQQFAQQQWAQATLQERTQLAHELHDGLSQNLGFLNAQAQTAQIYLQTGQPQAAEASLARLVEAALQIQGETREFISNLLSVSLPSQGPGASLRQLLENFQADTGWITHLEIQGDIDTVPDSNTVLQLLRILQEALANVRKHAGPPGQVWVRLTVDKDQLWASIEDNGSGFEPARVAGSENQHFGLQVMQQRAARNGGQLEIHSTPGQGTRVQVTLPRSQ
jgi:signal transduction histidine kinase